MLRRKLFAVLVTLTLVFTLTPLSAFAEEVMDGTSPPAQLEAAEQTGELLIGEEPEGDNGSGAGEGTATEEVPDDVPGEEDGADTGDGSDDECKYTLRIRCVDENNNTLHSCVVGSFKPGDAYTIAIPEIEGYTLNREKPVSREGVMPDEDLECVVYYSKAAMPAAAVDSSEDKAINRVHKTAAAAALTAADTRSYELTVIGEEKTPLAGDFLDSDCCILHLLIMLLAVIALILYTKDMKKRQKRIFELEDSLGLYD